jgi:hypothetical protein
MLALPVVGWFYPVHPLPRFVHLVARALATLSAASGYRMPRPRRADLGAPERMVAWIVRLLRAGQAPVLWTMPSAATRVSIAAHRAGQSLHGATFLVAGEPITEARRHHIEEAGARLIVRYGTAELSGMAHSCAAAAVADDAHLMLDRFAVAQRSRAASDGGPIVPATLFTALSLTTSTISLNLETGDYAHLEDRDCGCPLGALGLRTHLLEIRSFEKLTGEGVTFARSALQRILEEILPARFGGSAIDYQLAEEEGPDGATVLVLRVSPGLGALDDDAVREALFDELAGGSPLDRYQVGLWRNTGAVQVRREAPRATQAGKVLPFQLPSRSITPAGRT